MRDWPACRVFERGTSVLWLGYLSTGHHLSIDHYFSTGLCLGAGHVAGSQFGAGHVAASHPSCAGYLGTACRAAIPHVWLLPAE
jgi:hypothetical protein